jgi:hypothetical protein
VFAAWSDGGGQTHAITAPTAAATYTATFARQRLPQAQLAVRSVDSQETVAENGRGVNVLDGNPATIWHTRWKDASPAHPHEIQLDLGGTYAVTSLHYLPRQNSPNGRIGSYEVHVSASTTTWGPAVATGTWPNVAAEQTVTFPARTGRYLRLRALSAVAGGPWTTVAELNVGVAPRLPRTALTVRSVDSQETAAENGRGTNVLDGDPATIWHTQYRGASPAHPHEIHLDLGRAMSVSCLYYLPRQNSPNGRIAGYEIHTSTNGTTWGAPAATGTWINSPAEQTACFPARPARYLRLRALSEVGGGPWTTVAELAVAAT